MGCKNDTQDQVNLSHRDLAGIDLSEDLRNKITADRKTLPNSIKRMMRLEKLI
ncbi:MAG: hypothetical protein NTU95_06985 [Methanothrix sp.]|nr:hypothetical protein [Methanothrix sp.]